MVVVRTQMMASCPGWFQNNLSSTRTTQTTPPFGAPPRGALAVVNSSRCLRWRPRTGDRVEACFSPGMEGTWFIIVFSRDRAPPNQGLKNFFENARKTLKTARFVLFRKRGETEQKTDRHETFPLKLKEDMQGADHELRVELLLLVGAFRDARWCVVRRVPGILPLGLCY